MQRRLRILPLALCAGIVAVSAAAAPLIVASAQQQVQYTVTSHADIPGMGILKMFGAKGAGSTSTTTTISANRERIDDSSGTSEITQCDLKRVIHLDNNAKTYWSATFAEIQAYEQQAMQQAASRMQAQPQHTPSGTAPPPIQGSGSVTISTNVVNDPQTQTLFGMTAHHEILTITVSDNGTGQCPSGSMTMTNDEWYVPKVISFYCPLPKPPIPPMPRGGIPHGNPMSNPCFSRFQAEAKGKAESGPHFALKQTSTMDFGGYKITSHEDVTQYQVMPYNASFFDVPAGYSQVSPPQMGGH